MPVHDWSRVDAGIFHAFHHGWIEELARALNRGVLPLDYYALPEQHAAGFGPDVLTLTGASDQADDADTSVPNRRGGGLFVARPTMKPTAESDLEFYRRKQTPVVVRHVSGDRVVAMIEVTNPVAGRRVCPKFRRNVTLYLGASYVLAIHPRAKMPRLQDARKKTDFASK